MKYIVLLSVIALLTLAACQQPVQEEPNQQAQQAVSARVEVQPMTENSIAIIETNKGTIKVELYQDKTPSTAANFITLVGEEFYDGLTFHRYEPGFVIQGGDPTGTGTGGSEETIDLEIHPELTHVKGAMAMARKPDPNSASSQFYFTLAPAHFLDGNYAVFGQVIEGMDVVEQLRQGDVMQTIRIG